MFYLSVCEECWRGGSAVTGVVFHQGRGGAARLLQVERCLGMLMQGAVLAPPPGPATIIMLHLQLQPG